MPELMTRSIADAYAARFPGSSRLYARGKSLFPSGVTHDARFLQPFPVYVERAAGCRKHDVDGNELIDYWVGHGALLLGHSHPAVVDAVQKQVARSTHPGACHELELDWGELVRRLVPSCQMLRFTSSGTEATLMALRIARIAGGKSKVVKLAGMFHGWHDQLVPAAEPPHPAANRVLDAGGVRDAVRADYPAPGVTDGVFGDLVIVPPNNLAALERAIDEHDPACVIHEGNGPRWGVVPVRKEYLQGLRRLTRQKGVVLIQDEVITGFRVDPGGFQQVCDVEPDLTTMAKVLAGGLPGGCLGGRADLMQVLAFDNPLGKKMKHPGTYNANPLSAAPGIACLEIVATGDPCRHANRIAAQLRAELNEVFAAKSANWVAYGDYSAVKILPDYDGPRPTDDSFIPFGGDYLKLDRQFDRELSHAVRCALLLGGVDWMGWAGSTSSAHNEDDVHHTAEAFAAAIDLLRADGLIP